MPTPSRVAYWIVVVIRDTPRLIRLVLFGAGVFFLVTKSWYAGFGCFAVLLWWKANLIQARLEEIRNALRGFTDDEALEVIEGGGTPNQKGLLNEIIILLQDIRNYQMGPPARP
jgi:hypothetical protein